jgi:hypothetical protein
MDCREQPMPGFRYAPGVPGRTNPVFYLTNFDRKTISTKGSAVADSALEERFAGLLAPAIAI